MRSPLDIPVALVAGGLATRLRPLTEKVPKVLLPMAAKPFLAHQLELLRERGITRAGALPGLPGEMVVQEFDLAEVMERLVAQKQLAGYEVPERFYEIGSPADPAELEALLRAKAP